MNPIFEYFLFHFRSAFKADGISVSYGSNAAAQVVIRKSETSFFDQKLPYPGEPTWHEWKGTKIPFFFAEADAGKRLIEKTGSQVNITIDIVASAFYLLSGWQEFHSSERDNFHRFPYRASVQSKFGFVALPVVNYYFDILREAIQQATGRELTSVNQPKSAFTVCLTHDIDRCESGWKIAGKEALKKGRVGEFLKLISAKAAGKDSWFNLTEIAALEEKHSARSTWFFLPETRKVNGHPNADYDITKPKYRTVIKNLLKSGHEVGVHGSFGSGKNARQLMDQMASVVIPSFGNRFHYLQFYPELTADVLDQTGYLYDSSLGFAEHFGFRNSYCLPFRMFNFKTRQMHNFVELPLNLMDTTLRHPDYLWLEPEQILPAVEPMLQEIKKFNGCFTVLWHNEHFTGYQLPKDAEVYEQLLLWCKKNGAVFLTGREATEKLAAWT